MLAQDIDYFIDKQIPCSSSGYHILTKEDYYAFHREIETKETDIKQLIGAKME